MNLKGKSLEELEEMLDTLVRDEILLHEKREKVLDEISVRLEQIAKEESRSFILDK